MLALSIQFMQLMDNGYIPASRQHVHHAFHHYCIQWSPETLLTCSLKTKISASVGCANTSLDTHKYVLYPHIHTYKYGNICCEECPYLSPPSWSCLSACEPTPIVWPYFHGQGQATASSQAPPSGARAPPLAHDTPCTFSSLSRQRQEIFQSFSVPFLWLRPKQSKAAATAATAAVAATRQQQQEL